MCSGYHSPLLIVQQVSFNGGVPASENPAPGLGALLLDRLLTGSGRGRIGFFGRSIGRFEVHPQSHFLARAAGITQVLLDESATARGHVIVAASSPEGALLGFCGALMAGAVPAILPLRTAFDSAESIQGRLEETRRLLGPGTRVLQELRDGKAALSVDGADVVTMNMDSLSAVNRPMWTVDSGPISHIQLTSGSTGAGKGVAVTHANVLANCSALANRVELTSADVFVSWLPLYHDMGLVGQALMALVHDRDLFLMSPFDFLSNPSSWLRAISDHSGTLTASPNFGYEYVAQRASERQLVGVDLSSLKAACCGAEPITTAAAEAFSDRFVPYGLSPTAFKPCYGLAETTLAVTMPPMTERWRAIGVDRSTVVRLGDVTSLTGSAEDLVDVVALGKPVDGLTVHLIDTQGAAVAGAGVCGEIVVSGDSVAAGWMVDGELVPFPLGGVPTGDVGFLHEGELFVVDRLKNIVIRNGQNYSAQLLEQTLARMTTVSVSEVLVLDLDLERGCELTGVIEVDRDVDGDALAEIVRGRLDEFEPPLEYLVLVKRGRVPRTTSGKKRHATLRQMLRDDALPLLARYEIAPAGGSISSAVPDFHANANESDDERQLLALVATDVRNRNLDAPVLLESRLQYDLDFDSLGLVELGVAVEEAFDVEIQHEDLGKVVTVGDLLEVARSSATGKKGQEGPGLLRTLDAFGDRVAQVYQLVTEQRDRQLLIDGRWYSDFASLNYLGLDLHRDVQGSIAPMVQRWGTHPSWTRLVASPAPYRELEERLAHLVDAPDTVVFPTVSLLHFGVLPKLAGKAGAIILDNAGHHSMHEAAALARANGTTVTTFANGNFDQLTRKLEGLQDKANRIVVMNGVASMAGAYNDLPVLVDIAERYDATLYVDDAHGIGILGRDPSPGSPYGTGGGGIVQHFGLSYDRIVYVAGLSKAFSSMAAFVTARSSNERRDLETASTMIFGGPIPVASLATAIEGLKVNEREGDAIRARIWAMTNRLLAGARSLGLEADNDTGFPVVTIVFGRPEATISACEALWQDGFVLTPSLFPATPLDRGGARLSITAANTDDQVDRLLESLADVKEILGLSVTRVLAG